MADSKKQAEQRPSVEIERTRFKSFLLQNPNYFGNLEVSDFKPIKVIKGNTTFEQMVCVGLNPPYDRLEAVVQIKKESGYCGDICGPGSLEYVRFYVDLFDNGVWHDVGVSSVRVYDIPGEKPLCYAVRRDFNSFRKFCLFENIVQGPRDPAMERAAAGQFAQLHAGVGQRHQRASADPSAQVLPLGRSCSRSSRKSPSSFPIRSARSSRASIRPSS